MVPIPLRLLLADAVDYAGLFPPAALDLPAAIRNYAEYLDSPDRWALGRFVVPAARLEELERVAGPLAPGAPSPDPWPLAVLLSSPDLDQLQALGEFNCRHAGAGAAALSGDVVELKAESVEAIERISRTLPRYLTGYVEVPVERDPTALIAAIGRAGLRAKVRTGGVTPEAFPAARDLVRFLRACTAASVPFKATAGLHHPLHADYRLTYAPDSPTGVMYGFLNVFLAAVWLRNGMSEADAERLLEEGSAEAIGISDQGIAWREYQLDAESIRRARSEAIVSFGSCSFTEPLGDLRTLGLIR